MAPVPVSSRLGVGCRVIARENSLRSGSTTLSPTALGAGNLPVWLDIIRDEKCIYLLMSPDYLLQ